MTYNIPTKSYYVYIITNYYNTVLYTGVTNNLRNRIFQHKEKINKGFSKKYNTARLVYYELHTDIRAAIAQEKRIKKWRRQWKIDLINKNNPAWADLFQEIIKW